MYRFLLRPKWIAFHALVVAGVVVMAMLAQWQWNRYQERNDFVDRVEARQDAEPQDATALITTKSPAEIEYSRITATGSYRSEQLTQILRTQDGVNGVNVLTPFQIEGGGVILVNRGFVPDGTAVPAPPTGTLLIGGTARLTQNRRTGELTDNADGATTEVRRIDLPLISDLLDLDLEPIYIDFIGSQPEASRPPIPVPPPDLSGGPPHLSYAIQWCIFSICVIVGWVFAVRRSLRSRRRDAVRAAAEPDVTDGRRAQPSA